MAYGFPTYRRKRLGLPDPPRFGLPPVLNDFDLAGKIGIQTKTLWWAITQRKDLYKVFHIPKKNGLRLIHDPDSRLRAIQESFYSRFLRELPYPKFVAAYVPGRNVRDVAERHAGRALIIHMDIRDFFNRTSQGMVKDMFRDHLGYTPEVASLMCGLTTVPYRGRYFVPQGACTSGAVCNLVLWQRLDLSVLSFLERLGPDWAYDRYSDNLTISCEQRVPKERIKRVINEVRYLVEVSGYRVNEKKTLVQYPGSRGHPPRVLGMSVTQAPNIPGEEYSRLRAIVHNVAAFGVASQWRYLGSSPEEFVEKVRGKLRYWERVSEKVGRLLVEFEEALEGSAGQEPAQAGGTECPKAGTPTETANP